MSGESRRRRAQAGLVAAALVAGAVWAGHVPAQDPDPARGRRAAERPVAAPRPSTPPQATARARDAAARAADLPRGPQLETARVARLGGEPYVGANDLARLLGATKFWRPDIRKLVLRMGDHRMQLTVDNPFVVFDRRTLRLDLPVRSVRGEVHVPVALLDSLPRDSAMARWIHDPRRDEVLKLPSGVLIGTPSLAAGEAVTRIAFPTDGATEITVAGRARARFRVRADGFFRGVLPESLPPQGLVRAIRPLVVASGAAFEIEVAPEAQGYRLLRERAGFALEFSRSREGREEFAPEGPPGPRPIRVVVLDPGHGGDDVGATGEGVIEKDLALALARALRGELERRLTARVVLTRDGDATVGAESRAEAANRARADLVLSLHFDGYGRPEARGATLWCPPATYGEAESAPRPGVLLPVEVVPWRDVATRHAVPSRSFAEAVRTALELDGLGPVRVRERLTAPLLGVNAPGVVLECATLTSPADRERVTSPDGLRAMAAAIASAVVAYQRNE